MNAFLRLTADIETGLAFDPDGGASFSVGEVTVDFMPAIEWVKDDEDDSEYPVHGITVRLEARSSVECDGELAVLLDNWWRRLTLDDEAWRIANPDLSGGTFVVLPPGEAAWIRGVEAAVADMLRARGIALEAALLRTIGLIRWRKALPLPRPTMRLCWSLDETGTRWVSGGISRLVAVNFENRLDVEREEWLDESEATAVEDALRAHQLEPIAHEVLSEAINIRHTSPRASLVLGVTAAETALRSFSSGVRRASEAWLLERPGSGSVDELMSKYLPLVTEQRTSDGAAVIPRELRREIRSAAESRNAVVHHGATAPDPETLESYLQAFSDLLYLLDWLEGHDWAFANVSPRWRESYVARDSD